MTEIGTTLIDVRRNTGRYFGNPKCKVSTQMHSFGTPPSTSPMLEVMVLVVGRERRNFLWHSIKTARGLRQNKKQIIQVGKASKIRCMCKGFIGDPIEPLFGSVRETGKIGFGV